MGCGSSRLLITDRALAMGRAEVSRLEAFSFLASALPSPRRVPSLGSPPGVRMIGRCAAGPRSSRDPEIGLQWSAIPRRPIARAGLADSPGAGAQVGAPALRPE